MKSRGSSGYTPPGASDVQPQAHALSHAVGGTDPVTPAAIGAAAAADVAVIFARTASSNASGDTTLSIAATTRNHTEIITFSGAPRTSKIILPVANRISGDIVRGRLINTGVTGVVQEIRNASASGTVLYTFLSTEGVVAFDSYYDGTAFQPLSAIQPSL